mgnify:CR=1 FL=1
MSAGGKVSDADPLTQDVAGPDRRTISLLMPPVAPMPFDGVELPDSRKRLAGWSAARQRLFLETLAETGSVHLACTAARLSARSAYRLRARSPAFAAAWDTADQLAVGRHHRPEHERDVHPRQALRASRTDCPAKLSA